jgi:hypothetical protein
MVGEIITAVIGFSAGSGWGGTQAWRRCNRKWKKKINSPVEPICGCNHHKSYHLDGAGECHGLVKGDPVRFDDFGNPRAHKKIKCGCQHYVGPEYLPQFTVPEISG